MKLYELDCYPSNGATSYTIPVRVWAETILEAKRLAMFWGYAPSKSWRGG